MDRPEYPEPNIEPVLNVLSDYKMKLINTNTLTTQNPDELKQLGPLLRMKSKAIKAYILQRLVPPEEDTDLYLCIQQLIPLLNPWDADISVLSKYWCEKLFETENFSNAEHMRRIINQSKAYSIMPAGKEN
jgi:hypothetical protein